MTALAIALVLCCAMVCGTVLLHRRMTLRGHVEMEVAAQVDSLLAADVARREDINTLRSELETLRAQVALRSM